MEVIHKGLFDLRLETFKKYAAEGRMPGGYQVDHVQQLLDYANYHDERETLLTKSRDTYGQQLNTAEKEINALTTRLNSQADAAAEVIELRYRLKNQAESIASLYKGKAERDQFVDKQAAEIMALERQVSDLKTIEALVERKAKAWDEVFNLVRDAWPVAFIDIKRGETNKEVVLKGIRTWAISANKYETLVERIDEAIDEIEEDEDEEDELRRADFVVFDECSKVFAAGLNEPLELAPGDRRFTERQFREWHQR